MSKAAHSYAESAKAGMPLRDLEAGALLKAAARLHAAMTEGEATIDEALLHNRRLWTLFAAAASEETSPLPDDIRINVLTLANFVFNQTLSAGSNPSAERIEGLIAINRELAAGLRAA